MTDSLRWYRRWFYAAAVYNAAWAIAVTAFPRQLLRAIGVGVESSMVPFVQVIGMMVGVYAIGYYLLARDPRRYCGFIWIALAGKTLGPLGFIYYASTGVLPWTFGWTCVFNDLIWWPVFWSFGLRFARHPLESSSVGRASRSRPGLTPDPAPSAGEEA